MGFAKIAVGVLVVFLAATVALSKYSADSTRVVYYTISFYGFNGTHTFLGVRFYVENPTPAPSYIRNVTVTVSARGHSETIHVGNLLLPPNGQHVFETYIRLKGGLRGTPRAYISFQRPVYVAWLVELYSNPYRRGGPLPAPKTPFLWAGWNETRVEVGHCVSITARSYPLMDISVYVYEDLVGSKDRVVKGFNGNGTVEAVFCPEKPSGLNFKGYYLVVMAEKKASWVQPDGYPPRLTVTP